MSTVASRLGPPPAAPGSLTAPPSAKQVLTYLDALNRWIERDLLAPETA